MDELGLLPLLPENEKDVAVDYSKLPASKRLEKTLDRVDRSKATKAGLARLEALQNSSSDDAEEDGELSNFIWKAMKDAYDPHTNSVRDLKVDDRDLPLAANYFDFCANVAGKAIKLPFARQLWVAFTLLGEFCPRCTKPKWLDINNVPVDMDPVDLSKKVALLENGVCPYCGSSKAEMVLSGELVDYNQGVLVFGQRGGKSSFTATVAGYHKHRMLKSPRLSTICKGIQDFTPLTGTFVGITAARAIKLLWNPFTEIVKHSSWFDDYFAMLRHYGNQYGKEFYKEGGLFYRYYHKNLDYYPMGPQKRTLRGDTRIWASVDELGWFPYKIVVSDNPEEEEEDEREHANGDEVYEALDKSLLTVRSEVLNLYKRDISTVPTGIGLYISSPKSDRDKISRLLKDSDSPEALSLGLRLPTWEINPMYTRDHPIIVSAYKKNAIKAERDYGANPPKLDQGILDKTRLPFLFKAHIQNTHSIVYVEGEPERTVAKAIEAISVSQSSVTEIPPSIATIDAGLANNAFSITVGHRDGSKLIVPTVLEIVPKPGTYIDFPATYKNVILPILKARNVGLLVADRWNSIHLLQSAEDDTLKALKAKQISLNASHIKAILSAVEDGTLELPMLEKTPEEIMSVRNYKTELLGCPVSHLFLQMATVRESRGTLTKGEGFTDDIFRSLWLLAYTTFNPKVKEYMDKRLPLVLTQNKAQSTNRSIVLVAGRSGNIFI